MLASPLPSFAREGTKPLPLSRNSRINHRSCTFRMIAAAVQAEWRAILLTPSFTMKNISRRASAPSVKSWSESGASNCRAISREVKTSLANLLILFTSSLKRSLRGLMAQTMSLMASISSRDEAAMEDKDSPTLKFPSIAWRRATSLSIAINDRLAPMSSCRSAAMRVRTRSSSISRRTR